MSDEEINYYEQGREQCRVYYNSQAYAGLTRAIKAEDAIKLFWPNVDEMQIMVSMPQIGKVASKTASGL